MIVIIMLIMTLIHKQVAGKARVSRLHTQGLLMYISLSLYIYIYIYMDC